MAGRILRQGRLLAALVLSAAFLVPASLHAQDVVVAPPTANPADAALSPFDPTPPTPVAGTATASDPAVVTVPPLLARAPAPQAVATPADVAAPEAVAAPVAEQPLFDVNFQQCTTDADCVLVEDGCTTLAAVNQSFVQQWKAVMTHYPECKPIYDLAKMQLTVMATCRLGWCGMQPRTK